MKRLPHHMMFDKQYSEYHIMSSKSHIQLYNPPTMSWPTIPFLRLPHEIRQGVYENLHRVPAWLDNEHVQSLPPFLSRLPVHLRAMCDCHPFIRSEIIKKFAPQYQWLVRINLMRTNNMGDGPVIFHRDTWLAYSPRSQLSSNNGMVRTVYLLLQTHIPNYSVAYEELIDRERFIIRLFPTAPYCKVSYAPRYLRLVGVSHCVNCFKTSQLRLWDGQLLAKEMILLGSASRIGMT